MKKNLNDNDLKILFFVNIIILLLVVLTNTFKLTNTDIYKYALDSKNKIYDKAFVFLSDIDTRFSVSYDDLLNKNKNLLEENTNVNMINNQNNSIKEDLLLLQKMFDIKKNYSNYNIINSRCILRDYDSFNDEVTIDKGSLSKVKEESGVIKDNKLIGVIDKVSKDTSTVKLISSKTIGKLSLSVVNESGVYNGILDSIENNNLIIKGITNYADINVGDKVVTSGLGNLPYGLFLGTVSKIDMDNYLTSKIVYLDLGDTLSNINYVGVIDY